MGGAVPALRDLALDVDGEGPRVLAVTWIALERAALCLDCEACYDRKAGACPKCGSRSWALLQRWLVERRGAAPVEDVLVPISEVLHHAGNGLQPARLYAERLAEVLEFYLEVGFPRAPEFIRLAVRRARETVNFLDLAMARLRGLARPTRPTVDASTTPQTNDDVRTP